MEDLVSIRSPFKFLDPYDKEDRGIFFGREKEIEALYEHAYLSKLMLVYGASGTGKTSLINCGLRNRFAPSDWLTVDVRRGNHLVESLFLSLQERSKRGLSPGTLPIEQVVAQLYEEFFIPIYFLFDQFEELFIQGGQEEQQAFFTTLQRLLETDIPCKVILILREEYLAYLSDFEGLVPALFDNRFRIEPMNQRQLEDVVRKTVAAPRFGIVFDRPEENTQRILHNLRDERNEVELTNLQVYLDRLYKNDLARRRKAGADRAITFDAPLIDQLGQLPQVLSVFLDEQLTGLDQALNHAGLGLDILAGFVTNDGTKRQRSAAQTAESLQARRDMSADEAARLTDLALQRLVDDRLLRVLRIQEEVRYELSHDLLAGQVFDRFSAEEKALRKAERLLQSNFELHQDVQRRDQSQSKYLTEQELVLIDPYLPAIQAREDLLAYVEASRRYIREQRDAERLHLEAEARREKAAREEAERLKNEAEQGRRRARWLAIVAIMVALVALGLGLYARQQKKNADQATEDALFQAQQAEAQKGKADSLAIQSAQAAKDEEKAAADAKASEQKALDALAAAEREQRAKEAAQASENRVRFKTLAQDAIAFAKAGYCVPARRAWQELQSIARPNAELRDELETVRLELQKYCSLD